MGAFSINKEENNVLTKGPEKIRIESRDGYIPVIRIEADASFSAYGLTGGKREHLFGPFKSDGRLLTTRIPDGVTQIEIATAKSTFWQWTIKYIPDGKEHLDLTPLEIPIGFQQPPSLQDEMRRFIREEFGRVAESSEQETFEEADDFDIDEDPDPFSAYEMVDMIEEEPLETDSPPPEETISKNPTSEASDTQEASEGSQAEPQTPPSP